MRRKEEMQRIMQININNEELNRMMQNEAIRVQNENIRIQNEQTQRNIQLNLEQQNMMQQQALTNQIIHQQMFF